jgi:hypothetical protein
MSVVSRRPDAFTLVEILVSIMIFSIVSVAMVGILLTSTNVFRAGEYGRASTDEAVASLGVLDEDLKRMVPARDGGFFYTILHAQNPYLATPTLPPNGNCAVAFIITQPSPDAIQGNLQDTSTVNGGPANTNGNASVGAAAAGAGAHLLVVYYVEPTPVANVPGGYEDVLFRTQTPLPSDFPSAPPSGAPAGTPAGPPTPYLQDLVASVITPPAGGGNAVPYPRVGYLQPAWTTVVSRRCLHFGVWVSNDVQRRGLSGSWLDDTSGNPIPPLIGANPNPGTPVAYCTESEVAGTAPDPFPTAVRFTLTLSTGRYSPQGTFVSDLGGTPDQLRLTGINGLAVIPGAMIRIDSEWILYSDYRGGVLSVAKRAAMRSTEAAHAPGALVSTGQQYSLARTFPH